MYFDGPEKRIEVWISPGTSSLRQWDKNRWSSVVGAAGAKILSCLANDFCDAYLLSESSLFVFDSHFILITCGRTTVVASLLEFSKLLGSSAAIEKLFYSRKNQNFPQFQVTSPKDDIFALFRLFPQGELTGEDESRFGFVRNKTGAGGLNASATLELSMHNIQGPAQVIFSPRQFPNIERIRDFFGTRHLLPGYIADDFLFSPSGYSVNAISSDRYYTLHVTPEYSPMVPSERESSSTESAGNTVDATGSYVSFETNHRFEDLDHVGGGDVQARRGDVVSRLVALFRPRIWDAKVLDHHGVVSSIL